MTCELHNVKLDKAPPYSALSYTWNDEIYPESLHIDSQVLPVTTNLHDALMQIGGRLKKIDRFLWVDAICINQQDIPEQNSQVRLMKAIYEGAASVGVWLENDEENELAIAKMRELNGILHNAQMATR